MGKIYYHQAETGWGTKRCGILFCVEGYIKCIRGAGQGDWAACRRILNHNGTRCLEETIGEIQHGKL